MKTCLAAALLLAICPCAHARPIALKGEAADRFIARHFPAASIPGPVAGRFTEDGGRGRRRQGFARCDVPAMGARSDGAVSTCVIRF